MSLNDELLKAFFDECPDAIFLTSISPKRILKANKKASELFEMENINEFIGMFGTQFHKSPWSDEDNDNLNRILETQNFWTSEIEYFTKNKNSFWGSITIKGINVQNESFELVRIVDITKRKSLEYQLIQSQKMESIGTFVGGIAHDFNNLLAIIMGISELIKMNSKNDIKLLKYADQILDATDQGAAIAKQLLLFAKPDSTEFKAIRISPIIDKVQQMVNHFLPKKIVVESDNYLTNEFINGDNNQIYQIVMNLILNAADAMPNGGKIKIVQKNIKQEALIGKYNDAQYQEYVELSISDSGVGIPKELISRIFDPFFSTKGKGKGTGLGLSIVHGIVKSHHGLISVDSKPNLGTKFTLYLPNLNLHQIDDNFGMETMENVVIEKNKLKLTVLVVEDEKVIMDSLVEYLQTLDYQVHVSENGVNALNLYENMRESIDLIISDLDMPLMGGEEFIQKVFEINSEAKVIISSGNLENTSKHNLMKMGIYDAISKPFKFNELQIIIDKIIKNELQENSYN